MDFSLEYSKEQEEFAYQVRAWADSNIPQDYTFPADPAKLSYEQYQMQREVGRKLGEKGWLVPMFPKEYGGGGLSLDMDVVLEQELYKYGMEIPPYYDLGLMLAAPAVLTLGTEEQKKNFLPPMLMGDVVTWQLFTEPEAGSDLANVKTTAIREGNHFVINGQKMFVGGMYEPEQFWLLARTDPDAPRHKNLGMFIVPSDLPGITVNPINLLSPGDIRISSSAGTKNMVFLDNVNVPQFHLIGGETDGWMVANTTLEVEHGNIGSITGNRVADKFLDQCKTNPYILKRFRENPQLIDEVIDIYIGCQIERLFVLRNFWLRYAREPHSYEGNQTSLYGKEFNFKLSSAILNVLGPYALTNDPQCKLEEIFEVQQRVGIAAHIPGGTAEIQKVQMARRLGIGRTEREKAAKLAI